jgi:hypothetical protein
LQNFVRDGAALDVDVTRVSHDSTRFCWSHARRPRAHAVHRGALRLRS